MNMHGCTHDIMSAGFLLPPLYGSFGIELGLPVLVVSALTKSACQLQALAFRLGMDLLLSLCMPSGGFAVLFLRKHLPVPRMGGSTSRPRAPCC